MQDPPPSPESIFEQHYDYLYVLSRCQLHKLGLNKIVETEEVLRETWLRFSKAGPAVQFESTAKVIAWLKKCVQSVVYDFWRHEHRQKRDRRREAAIEEMLDQSSVAVDNWLAASQTSPSRAACRDEDIQRVSAALRRLPDEIRDVMICKFVLEMKRQDIADTLGITLNEVDYRRTRGLQDMKDFLA